VSDCESTHVLQTIASRTGWPEIRSERLLAQNTEMPRPLLGERDSGSESFVIWQIKGVHIVHTLGVGLGRIWVGSGRIPYVSAGVQCSRGLECSSSPTSGTHNPSSEGFLL